MDECLGSFMPLFFFVEEMPKLSKSDKIMYYLMSILLKSEQEGRTWFLRPVMFRIIERLFKALEQKKIQGAFIFSNNASDELVNFVASFLNFCIREKFGIGEVNVFQMAISRNSPARKGYGLIKNYEVIQKCLQHAGLPPCSSEQDLMFFDDMNHELERQIPNYVHVPAYFNQTEINTMFHTIHPLHVFFKLNDWIMMCKRTIIENKSDYNRPDNQYKSVPQPTDEYVRDLKLYNFAFIQFMRPNKNRQTRKRNTDKVNVMPL